MNAYANQTKSVTVTNSTYLAVHDGYRNAIAWSSAAWRLSDEVTPDAGEFVSCPANAQILLPRGATSFARGESGSATVNVVIQDQ